MHKRYAQYRADKVDTNAHWHICLPLIPARHQSKQKSQSFPPATEKKIDGNYSDPLKPTLDRGSFSQTAALRFIESFVY